MLDRVTLQPLANQTVTGTTALSRCWRPWRPFQAASWGTLQLGRLSAQVVVVIQSVGTGALTFDATDSGISLLQVIDQLGGTPETFGPAITQGKPYALVGVASNLPWHGRGIESSPVISSKQSGRARGVLARDRWARYTPAGNDPVGSVNLDLFPIVYQDPTPCCMRGTARSVHRQRDRRRRGVSGHPLRVSEPCTMTAAMRHS